MSRSALSLGRRFLASVSVHFSIGIPLHALCAVDTSADECLRYVQLHLWPAKVKWPAQSMPHTVLSPRHRLFTTASAEFPILLDNWDRPRLLANAALLISNVTTCCSLLNDPHAGMSIQPVETVRFQPTGAGTRAKACMDALHFTDK